MLKKIFLSLTILICFAILSTNAFAATSSFGEGLNATAQKVQGLDQQRTLTDYLVFGTQAFLTLIGVIFVSLLVYGGFLYMTAAGSDEKIAKSKKAISSAVVGLILIVAGQSITVFISSQIEQPGEGITPQYQEQCQNPYEYDYFSIGCCEYRYQLNGSVHPECCDQTPFLNLHKAECDADSSPSTDTGDTTDGASSS